MIVDMEPLLREWGSAVRIDEARVAELRGVAGGGLLVATNSRVRSSPDPAVRVVYGARKPWLKLGGDWRGAVVIGDQPLTDGLLAWCLEGTYIEVSLPSASPLGVRLQRVMGSVLCAPFFAWVRVAR